MEIKQYKVEKGISTPVNPFICSEMFYIPCRELPDGENCPGCNDHIRFEKLIPANTYATNAQDGVYDADCFGEPYEQGFSPGVQWVSKQEVNNNSVWAIMPKRKFLPFNPIPKMETTELPSPEKSTAPTKTHELKTWPAYFEQIWEGMKGFELRKNDRGYKPFESLLLREYLPATGYTGRSIEAIITYVLEDVQPFGLKHGFCIISFKIINYID